ncbi:hypothetical protein PTKIN_Ptkin07bG0100200 [Pterospermum kingtungense]
MLPLKLVREAITQHPLLLSQKTHHHHTKFNLEADDHDDNHVSISKSSSYNFYYHSSSNSKSTKPKPKPKTKIPLLLFLPTRELISDIYRLATIAREMGMDLCPTPSLSHIIFSYPSSSSSSSSSSTSSVSSSSYALSLSSSFSMPLPNDAVLISFPSLSSSSLSHLRSFVSLSKGLFKLVFITTGSDYDAKFDDSRNWDCCSISLFSRLTGDRIESMQAFSRALAGMGWTLFNTRKNPSANSTTTTKSVYLFKKVDSGGIRGGRGNGVRRIRELRLPSLDFRNAPLKILQYVVLMADDVFYLG